MSLVIDNLVKTYGELRALDGMSFTVHPGEIYGFVGSNGAGKTTTMRIALGVLEQDSGEVRLGDRVMDETLRRTVGYMPEERGLYPKEKVGKQLAYFARLHGVDTTTAEQRTKDLLETLGLTERVDDKVEELSLGNQQRVQLAAALVHNPDVLVLDEPFSGLDPIAVEVMAGVLRDYAARGVPVVFSSHQLDLVERLCDRVGIIRDGRMLAEGTVAELRQVGPRLLQVDAPAAPQGWADSIPGVVRTEYGQHTRLELADDAADDVDQQILNTALSHGPVRSFGPVTIPLTELYQEVITNEE
ncbi:ATP-binding cassette domain-containing protein [Corynebacterium sp. TAE3-ERU12]|uniref:ABC transporter ATP-binding protein n=1 Tax=Corynebacterium sp. TAE3-ERU12 TaxID=2849491 RepID=UPI001C446CF1|nr:ATP-binding cassette domain-containing protein [Corynebacterium sp. TAE3-ERU12]MBV7295559.1 ATP-binding cassette domain-containing protein [Corynebacterium sp. TAE3-ERU12]